MSKTNSQNTKLTIVLLLDQDTKPDDFDCYDGEALRSWKRDDWHYVGVVLRIESNKGACSKTYESPGIWGVEHGLADSADERKYLFEIAGDQLQELQAEYPELADVSLGYPCVIKEEF